MSFYRDNLHLDIKETPKESLALYKLRKCKSDTNQYNLLKKRKDLNLIKNKLDKIIKLKTAKSSNNSLNSRMASFAEAHKLSINMNYCLFYHRSGRRQMQV